MPLYTYRREDGTTFDYRQSYSDDPLTLDPATGQRVVRVVQAAGVIFKGSGFYVNDSKGASRNSANGSAKKDSADTTKPEAKSDMKSETKSESSAPTQQAAAD
jgi:predicted nucleic acid-binding Zn ribbon protein